MMVNEEKSLERTAGRLRFCAALHQSFARRRFVLRQIRVRLTRVQPVLDFDRVRRQGGSGAALTAPGLLRQAKRAE